MGPITRVGEIYQYTLEVKPEFKDHIQYGFKDYSGLGCKAPLSNKKVWLK
jgi:hypothetical protein